jgi:aspartate racemase
MIGILAGMGPHSTAPFIDLVIAECQRQYGAKDDIDFPKMMIHSVPTPFYADRPSDHHAMEAAICQGLQKLDQTGVSFIAIACNTAHVYYPQLAKCIRKPILNMVQLTVDLVPRSVRRLAVIAARPTTESGVYQSHLLEHGFEVIEPDWQLQIDQLIVSVRSTKEASFFNQKWNELITIAKVAGADALVLACLDLSAIRQHMKTDMVVVDASQSLAKSVVSRWLKERQQI